jgi:hypothetical protein
VDGKCGLDLSGSGWGLLVGSCEHDNVPSGSINGWLGFRRCPRKHILSVIQELTCLKLDDFKNSFMIQPKLKPE